MSESTSSSSLRCVVVTPEQTVLDTTAEFIALPLFDGEVGIALHHSPMIGRLGYGELRIRNGESTDRYYVDGGFVQIADNVVSVLTNRSTAAAEVELEVAQEQLSTALGRKGHRRRTTGDSRSCGRPGASADSHGDACVVAAIPRSRSAIVPACQRASSVRPGSSAPFQRSRCSAADAPDGGSASPMPSHRPGRSTVSPAASTRRNSHASGVLPAATR